MAFKDAFASLADGAVLKPILFSILERGHFERSLWEQISQRMLDMADHGGERSPDGWFHPSEHPTWPARKLYYYLTEPDSMIREPLELGGFLSVTVGQIMHDIIQVALLDHGVLLDDELALVEEDCRARGHTDGVLGLDMPGWPEKQLFEFKTSNARALWSVEDMDVGSFKDKWPGYYFQAQEYMRMGGYRMMVVLVMGMGFPWEMREFHVPYDPPLALDVKKKYVDVLRAADDGQVPPPCCAPGSTTAKSCPARAVCPIGNGEVYG